MGLFSCRGCRAKDEEIKHLMWVIEGLQSAQTAAVNRISEIQSPGAVARASYVPPDPVRRDNAKPQRQRVQTLPGYEPEYQDDVEIL